MRIFFCKTILFLLIISSLEGCSNNQPHSLDPTIKNGRIKVTGKIIDTINNKENMFVYMTIPHPVTGENVQYKVRLDSVGNFCFDVRLETNSSIGGIYSDINLFHSLFLQLKDGSDIDLKITNNTEGDIKNVDLNNDLGSSTYDVLYGWEVMNKMIDYRSNRTRPKLYEKSTDYFLNFVDTVLNERLDIVNNDTLLSEKMRDYLHREFRLFLYTNHAFNYEEQMRLSYLNINGDNNLESLVILKPGISYYSFLRKLDLNNPLNLYNYTFPELLNIILNNEIIGIPRISQRPIEEWLQDVRSILSDLVGFDKGLFYDLLVSNAYSMQFNNEMKPLSEKQIENIKIYFKGNEIEKILLRRNQEIIDFDKKRINTVINTTPKVNNEDLMDAIISKYKNKVVLVDLWATWCAPCLLAIQNFAETKNTFKEKDIIFVYITNPSSPYKLWKSKSEGIGGEHYYLSDEQWNFIMNQFKFTGIPSYLLYNKQGVLKEQITGSPDPDEMDKMITNILIKNH